jgi:hypothetical protein
MFPEMQHKKLAHALIHQTITVGDLPGLRQKSNILYFSFLHHNAIVESGNAVSPKHVLHFSLIAFAL